MNIFNEISVIIVIATAVAAIMRLLRQPLIIGHIITGLVVGPYLLNLMQSHQVIDVFAEIGIALLLFIVGLGLNPKLIKEVGAVSLVTGLGQVAFTSLVGFLIARGLGFATVPAAYIAIALTFSSTIIIVKLLSDKQGLQKLYGKIALGFLLVQDLVATFILIGVSALANGESLTQLISTVALQGIALLVIASLVSIYILPHLGHFFAKSQEFLFLFSTAWGLGLATLFHVFGFSVEIGALVAGITLSLSPYHTEISAKMKPLRDFFIILFFILLGSKMVLGNIAALLVPTIVFSLFILIGNPLIVMVLMGALGYNKRTGFLAGLTVAQISEFSLILIMLAVRLGHVSETILSLTTFVGLITIAGSTYLIMYAEKIYPYLAPALSIFERTQPKREKTTAKRYDIILFGHNRVGYDFVHAFEKIGKKYLVVDFDPNVISYLTNKGVPCLYGDAEDTELLDDLQLEKVKMVVSTIPETETNLLLVKKVKEANTKALPVVIAHSIHAAEKLYDAGAAYVILPHFLGGYYTAELITKHGLRKRSFEKEQKKHRAYLDHRRTLGHEHPTPNV